MRTLEWIRKIVYTVGILLEVYFISKLLLVPLILSGLRVYARGIILYETAAFIGSKWLYIDLEDVADRLMKF